MMRSDQVLVPSLSLLHTNKQQNNMSAETKDVDMADATVEPPAPAAPSAASEQPPGADSTTTATTTTTMTKEASNTSSVATAAKSNKAPPRFEIKKWNAVAMWSWDICADTCAICRNSLNEPSIEYQANPSPTNDNGLSIAFGNCGHVFHLDCIQRWLKTRSVCPLCNKEWDFAKIERIPGYGQLGI